MREKEEGRRRDDYEASRFLWKVLTGVLYSQGTWQWWRGKGLSGTAPGDGAIEGGEETLEGNGC